MTQLGEMVAVGLVDEAKIDCPFHEGKHQCDPAVKSVYREGDAEALGKNLHAGAKPESSTVVRAKGTPDDRYRSNQESPDPDQDSEKEREVSILAGDADCVYPVAFAAHHLIPGKAALGRAKALHKFLRKGEFCCNLGYTVDGNENGVWLPGLHAVNSNGLNLWSSRVAKRSLPDKEDVRAVAGVKARMRYELEAAAGKALTKYAYKPLVGTTPGDAGAQAFRSDNLKWRYVQKSMAYLDPKRQFHDAHPAYSAKVQKHLGQVAARLAQLLERSKKPGSTQCPECKKRADAKPTPPIGLLGLLNKSSKWYRGRLEGKTRHAEYYTSSWCGPLALVKPRKQPRGRT